LADKRRSFVGAVVRQDGGLMISHNWSDDLMGITLAQAYADLGILGSPDLQIMYLRDLRAVVDVVCSEWWVGISREVASLRLTGQRAAVDPERVYFEVGGKAAGGRKPIDHL